jgi:hypothetical protein
MRSTPNRTIYLLFMRKEIGHLLRRRLEVEFGETVTLVEGRPPVAGGPAIVVGTVRGIPLDLCDELVAEGQSVVVLGLVPRAKDESDYLAHGAYTYMPLALDMAPLVDTLEGLVEKDDATMELRGN